MNYQFELLKELCTICKENDIKYFLYGTLMQAAYSDGIVDPEWDSYDIVVTGEGFRKLQEVLSSDSFIANHPNRELESLLTNPNFPGFYANYVATDTLRFDFRDGLNWFQNKGLAIHILIIVNKGPKTKKAKLIRALRKAYLKIVRKRPRNVKERFVFGFYKTVFAIGGSSLKQKLFDNYLNCWKSFSRSGGLYFADGRYNPFRKNFWDVEVEKTLDDITFTVPQICSRVKVAQRLYNLNVIHSDAMSYDDFERLCRIQNIDLRKVYDYRKKLRGAMMTSLLRGRKSKRYYNAAFYSTLIRRNTSRSVDQCKNRSLDSPDYYAIIEDYLENIIEQARNGITPYVTLDIYLDAMKMFLEDNQKMYRTRDEIIYKIMLKYVNKIPDHYFLKSPVVSDSCYSIEELTKDVNQLRAELEIRLHELAWDYDKNDNWDDDSSEK